MEPWFKRRRFGWGWTPIRWQGWIVVAVALIAIASASVLTSETSTFVVVLVFITSVLAVVSYWTSEEYRM